jgi:hypothetical protein
VTVGTPTADMARNGVPDTAEDAGDPAGRCFSAPTGMPQSEASVARSGQLNEEVFTGGLVGASTSTSGLSHGARSMTQPQLSKGKRRWQGAAQKVIAMHQITSTFRPGALQVGCAGAQVAGSTLHRLQLPRGTVAADAAFCWSSSKGFTAACAGKERPGSPCAQWLSPSTPQLLSAVQGVGCAAEFVN